MIDHGTVLKVEKNIAHISAPSPVGGCCGGSKGDSCCSGKSVTVKAEIPEGLELRAGDNVELSPPKQGAFLSLLRVILIPGALFLAAYLLSPLVFGTNSMAQNLSGASGFLVGLLANLLFPRQSDLPRISRVISNFGEFTPINA